MTGTPRGWDEWSEVEDGETPPGDRPGADIDPRLQAGVEHLQRAAKEAIAKALGAPVGMAWHDAEIVSEETGRPRFEIRGTVAARAEAMGVAHVHVSLSHDAGIASAVVVAEG